MAADVQTNLRFPVELKEALLAAAVRNNRSLSAEVIFRLVHSFSHDPGLLQPSEPEELRREKESLKLRLEVMLGRLNMLDAVSMMRNEQFHRAGLAGDAEAQRQHELENVASRQEVRALHEQIAGIKGRLKEIEADLMLPEVPDALSKLAHLMPK